MQKAIQSSDFKPGVRGWQMVGDQFRAYDGGKAVVGKVEALFSDAAKPAAETPKPFIVVDGVVYLRQAAIEQSIIDPAAFKIKLDELGRCFGIGIGIGISAARSA